MAWTQQDLQIIKNMIKQLKHFESLFGIADFNGNIDKGVKKRNLKVKIEMIKKFKVTRRITRKSIS